MINSDRILHKKQPMKLITEVELPGYSFQMDHQSRILMMGSCFTEEIGRILEEYLFPVCINPFGVTYNPASVLNGLNALQEKGAYDAGDLHHHDGLWISFDHYTRFSHPDREEALQKINRKFHEAKKMLENAQALVITWGTAWIYRHIKSDRVVNNCHKIPSREFSRSRLTPGQVIKLYEPLISSLISSRPDLQLIFTVSPVRHWKDGAHGNQLSKAVLLLAADELVQAFPLNCCYFPSFEIVMDELRDYRYYGSDLVHTNELAIRYIWEKFSEVLIHKRSLQIIRELDPLLRMKAHRPFRSEGIACEKWISQINELQQNLQQKYPELSWSNLD
jgi:hypothetical protein